MPKKFKNIFISEVEKTRINILKYACKFHFGENPNKKHFRSEQKMKDIFEILKNIGIEVPEDKHKDLRRSLNENYFVIDEHKNKLEKVSSQLETVNDTITDLKTIYS